jgi:hypothetical protein
VPYMLQEGGGPLTGALGGCVQAWAAAIRECVGAQVDLLEAVDFFKLCCAEAAATAQEEAAGVMLTAKVRTQTGRGHPHTHGTREGVGYGSGWICACAGAACGGASCSVPLAWGCPPRCGLTLPAACVQRSKRAILSSRQAAGSKSKWEHLEDSVGPLSQIVAHKVSTQAAAPPPQEQGAWGERRALLPLPQQVMLAAVFPTQPRGFVRL